MKDSRKTLPKLEISNFGCFERFTSQPDMDGGDLFHLVL